jgi:hypothetical protein
MTRQGLGYKESLKIVKGESSTSMTTNEKPTSYANALKGKKQQVPESYQVGRQILIPTSKFFIPRHPNSFYGYCFSWENFGHKFVSCIVFRYNRSIGKRFNKPQKDIQLFQ